MTLTAQKISYNHIKKESQEIEMHLHTYIKDAHRSDTLILDNKQKVVCDLELYFDNNSEELRKSSIEFYQDDSSVLEEMFFKGDRLIYVHINDFKKHKIVEIYYKDYTKMIVYINGVETKLNESEQKELCDQITRHIEFLIVLL